MKKEILVIGMFMSTLVQAAPSIQGLLAIFAAGGGLYAGCVQSKDMTLKERISLFTGMTGVGLIGYATPANALVHRVDGLLASELRPLSTVIICALTGGLGFGMGMGMREAHDRIQIYRGKNLIDLQ